MNTIILSANPVALTKFVFDLRVTRGREKRREPVEVRHYFIGNGSTGYVRRPANGTRDPICALPIGEFFTAVGCDTAIRPKAVLRAVVGVVNDDSVLRYSKRIQHLQYASNPCVVLQHSIGIQALSRCALPLLGNI